MTWNRPFLMKHNTYFESDVEAIAEIFETFIYVA